MHQTKMHEHNETPLQGIRASVWYAAWQLTRVTPHVPRARQKPGYHPFKTSTCSGPGVTCSYILLNELTYRHVGAQQQMAATNTGRWKHLLACCSTGAGWGDPGVKSHPSQQSYPVGRAGCSRMTVPQPSPAQPRIAAGTAVLTKGKACLLVCILRVTYFILEWSLGSTLPIPNTGATSKRIKSSVFPLSICFTWPMPDLPSSTILLLQLGVTEAC